MPNKLQAYAELAERTARQITGSHLAWTAFLTTAARLYKYPYNEQLMIYMQRPEATACAEYDFWNEKMGRYVRRGSTGIALIDATGYKPRLKYVFDVSDTGGKENARRVNLWELKDAHTDSVSAMLERNYGVSGKNGLAEQFESVASQLAAEYWRDHSRDILGIVADSYLEEYDDYNIEVAFKNAAAVSITYSLMSRCGMQPEDHFEHEDFFSIFDFNTPRTVAALGTAVSEINEQVLRQIEVTIRNYEREHSAERTAEHGEQPDLHDERRLHDPRPEDRGAGAAPRQVRADAPEVPEGASAHPLEPDDSGGNPVPAPAGDRAGGAEPLRADDAEAGGGGRSDGEPESPRPNEMGGPDEHLQGAGGGSDSRGADLRITEHPARGGQLSFFPTEAEQITAIEEAESAQAPFAFSVSQAQLDHVLRLGGNADDTRMVIAAAFQKQKSVEDVAALLQSTFHGGNGFKTPEGELSAWYAVDGIHIAPGRSAEYVRSAQVIAWQDAAARISELMDSGAYASNVELAEAGQHERMQLAQALWYLKHDLSDEAREQGYLSCMDTLRGGGFPDETARLAEQLTNTDFRETLSGEFAQFYAAHEQDRSLLRFHYHKLDQIWQSLRDLSLPRREYSSEMAAVPELARFITEDEIDHALDRGSGVEGGKGRIYEYFTADHTGKEKAAFLKDEYGIGGRSHAVSGASHSDESHDSRGIVLKKAGCANAELSWTKVAARIDALIQKDRFLSPREKERYAQLQREKEAERELPTQAQIDYNSIKEAHPDDIVLFQVGDFFEMYGEDAKQAAELLALNLTTRAIPSAGRVEMCGIPAHNLEMYVEKLRDKYDVTIAEAPDFRGERHIYTLRSIDHEAEAAINAYEAEFGADGTRVFRDPAADAPQPTVRELFDGYKLTVGNALSKDTAFVNACRNSDRQNAYLEGADAIRRIVTASDDLQLVRLYFDMPAFHNRLHQELLEELYPTLAATVAPSPYQITQEDIDNALLDWHNNLKGKQEVALYMQAHGRERSTAAWLAAKYGWEDSKTPMYIHVGNAEPVTLTWAQVQRRLAQLIRENKFYDENERLRLFSPDRYSIRLHPGEGGITGIWDEVLERFCGDGEQTLRFAEQNNAIAYLDGIKRDMGIELSPPAFTTPLGYTYHIGYRISSIELDHIAAVGVIARVDEDHVWHTLPNVPGQEPVSIDRNSFERYLDTRYFEVSEPEPQRVIAAQHTEQPTPETPQAVQNLMGQRVEIDGKLYNVDSADETVAHLSVVSSSSESNHDPEHRTEPVSAVLTRIADQGRELAPNISAYQALRAEHPEKLIGVRVGERLLFYGADAERASSALNRRLLQRDIPGMGETAVTGYDFGQWASGAKRLLEHGHSFVFAQPNETDGYDVINEADAKEYIPIGMELEIDGRKFVIDSVNFGADEVSLRDVTFQNRQGFPIFRAEHIAFVRSFVEEQEQEQPQPIAKPVAFYPAEKTHLPYDIEIKTLHIPEPEHDPPSAEPAKPEPPAMSEEEALILEQEGRAALSEMGEFVPDSDDAISQAEIDEPPAHRPAVSIPVDGEWQGFPSVAAAEQAAYADFKAASHRDAQNFHITDDALGVGGAKAKFRANMAAIHLLQELEFEGLQASPEQQEILSRYVGWGGLADAFDENKPNWSDEFAELYATLSPEEYAAARASTLNAHYTSPTVIKAIYEAVGNMGFQTGNILEPSMGVGNFFGLLPEQMQGSKLYGVELDSITGRIAKQLYPKADITIAGFETTDRKDFYDLAVGNVPFGQYQVDDQAYNKLGFSIHDYFFAKTLDQVRPGGVIAFVTSRYTMDKQSPEVRRYIAQRAELLGAIRLPNNAFRANAGTDVVSDILFLQKRDRPIEIDEDWIHLGQSENGFAINSYFAEHPEMVLGTPSSESTQYGKQDYTVNPIDGADLGTLLHEAVQNIGGKYQEAELPDLGENEKIGTSIPADPNVKNFSYTIVDGDVYYRENSVMVKPDLNATAKERVKGMVQLRDCVQKLIGQQMDGFISDETIHQTQRELDALYDSFTEKYGLINARANNLAFSDDSSYFLLCSLEVLDEENNLKCKADIFTKRTIRPHEAITSVDTASEALALSISEKACVDMDYMAQLSGKSQEELVEELTGVIFFDPVEREWQTADEYLSGDVREKLRIARSYAAPGFPRDGLANYAANVAALEQAQPKDLDASEIEVRLGATWIDKEYIRQFMFELLEPAFYVRRSIDVNYSDFSAEWNITGKSVVGRSDINANMTYGTERANAYKILEDTLNLRDVRIYDTVEDADGREKRVLNSKETTLAQQKQQAIKDAFQEWIWKDPTRRHDLVQKYNELFNSTHPREYNGQHITFSGMNPEIQLREHQLNAVAHILYGGNTLLAHEVGAGKTFEMVAAAMESKRLGLCHKPMFVVPNHLIEQWASEFLRLYPSANILAVTKKDFEPRNRKKFCARIATGDYDAVIIGHSQFERIPVSRERQERMLQEQIYEIEDGLMELKANNAERFTIKSLEKTKKSLEVKLKKLQDTSRKDDVITFEQLGVDRLYVDEAHAFKNLFLYTKMRNVAGLSTTDAQKSSDMLLKCRYIDEITGNKGIVFATGTPVSNSMTELYTMMRYLQHDMLQRKHLTHFDCWASTFGETATAIELAPEGTGYRARTRFSKFFNLPELMQLFKEAADIKTADQLHLPTPTPIYHNVVAQPTEIQKGMVQELSERAAKVHAGIVDASTDNMLKITSDGRKLGLDQRVINPDLPDEAGSKVNLCVDNIYSVWKDGQADKLTQLVFCDLSTPKAAVPVSKAAKAAGGNLDSPELHALETAIGQDAAEEPAFTIYDDIREKLVARGIPREQIAFIHEANTEARKKELFAKVRAGQVRVLMGSTFKMGAGMNVQDRLVALHDLDCPWRPGDLEQRSGRIIRQGNRNKEVHIYRYVTESTFDAYLWQTVENKQKFISQIMTSKSPVRSCEDVDETALSYAEIKALCAGDERIKEKMDLDVDVARLKLMKANHQSQQYKLEDSLLKKFPEEIEKSKGFISGLEADMKTLAAHPHPEDGFAGMTVKNDNLTDKDNAGAALLEAFKDVRGMEPVPIGTYRGFQISLTLEDFGRDYVLTLKGQMTHRVTLGKDARGNLTRIDNALNAMPDRLQNVRNTLDATTAQMEAAKAELGKPFPQEEELRVKSARLAELNAELNIDERTPMEQLADDAAISAKAERPSVLARLKNTPVHQAQDARAKQREQESR